jgi:hypothetical protein
MSGYVTEGERVMYNVYIMSGYVTEGERVMYNVLYPDTMFTFWGRGQVR